MWISLLAALIAVFGMVTAVQYHYDMKAAYKRFKAYDVKTIETEFGTMSYVDEGTGKAILISHGIFGGYDQGYSSLKQIAGDHCRKIAFSRFGYPGRVSGLILLSSGVPDQPRSAADMKELGMMGPPQIIIHDFPMWFVMKYFGFVYDGVQGGQQYVV